MRHPARTISSCNEQLRGELARNELYSSEVIVQKTKVAMHNLRAAKGIELRIWNVQACLVQRFASRILSLSKQSKRRQSVALTCAQFTAGPFGCQASQTHRVLLTVSTWFGDKYLQEPGCFADSGSVMYDTLPLCACCMRRQHEAMRVLLVCEFC